MATNSTAPGTVARELPFQAVHYLRKTVNFNDVGIATGVPFGAMLPAGASIVETLVKIKTAFNAGTTNVLTVGQNSTSYNDMVAAGDVNEAAVAATKVVRGSDLNITSDVTPYIKYTQTGDAATTGVAEVTIFYTVNNDG